jgi:predicted deacylase
MPATVQRTTMELAGLTVPVLQLTGQYDGPLLTVIAGVHGCEYAAMAGVRQWAASLAGSQLAGRVRAVPVLNLPAFTARSPFVIPADGKNLNRCFPGDPAGTIADRLAYATCTELIAGSDAVVDAHSGDLVEALEPFAMYDAGQAEQPARDLANAYGLGYLIRQQPGPGQAVAGTTSSAAAALGIPAIIAEAGGCGLVEQHAVAAHVRGLNGVLAALGMLPWPDDGPSPNARHLDGFRWLYTEAAGWWQPEVAPGDQVTAGQEVGSMSSLDGAEILDTILAPVAGVVMFVTTSPAVASGGLLLGLGTAG